MSGVRFAPAPSGALHAGNGRVALLNFLLARERGWRFVLRFDDTDASKVQADAYQAIRDELNWLAIAWDEECQQKDRTSHYEAAFERLRQMERVYACYETAEELNTMRRMHIKLKQPPRYNKDFLSPQEKQKRAQRGDAPHWRFVLSEGSVGWHDGVFGDMNVALSELSDPVIRRSDGTMLYLLLSVVDDDAMTIAHVIRGSDHLTNTAAQLDMARALQLNEPQFSHVGLVVGEGGRNLSKRDGSHQRWSLRALRDRGYEAMTVANVLAGLGGAQQLVAHNTMTALIDSFDLAHVSRAPLQLSERHFASVNESLLHRMDFADVASRLRALLPSWDEKRVQSLWRVMRDNVRYFDDIKQWDGIIHDGNWRYANPLPEDRSFFVTAHQLAQDHEGESWQAWLDGVSTATQRKGRAMMMPLRLALTGRTDGPALSDILQLLGREQVAARLAHVAKVS